MVRISRWILLNDFLHRYRNSESAAPIFYAVLYIPALFGRGYAAVRFPRLNRTGDCLTLIASTPIPHA